MATAGMNGHKAASAPTGARAGSHSEQPKGDRFSDLLAAPSTHTEPTHTKPTHPQPAHAQAQKPAQNPAEADAAKTPTHSDKKAAATTTGQTPTAPDRSDATRTGKTDAAATQSNDRRTDAKHAAKDRDHKADTADSKTLPATAQDGKTIPPINVKDTGAKDTDAEDLDIKDTEPKSAGKKDDTGKKLDPKQTQSGTGIPSLTAGTLQAANAAATQQAAPQTNTVTDKDSSNTTAAADTNAPGVAAVSAGALINAANLTPATGRDPRDSGKTDPAKSTDKTPVSARASAQKDAQSTTAAAGPNGSSATNQANNPATDLLAALTGKAGGPAKGGDSAQDAKTDTASVQKDPKNIQAPAPLPSQQNAQNNQAPAPAGSLTMQSMIPDPSALGAGSAGMGGHIITTAAQGAAASTGAASLPQALQINQMPLPLPNMTALGIAIATRSLSGSRQFDIRLDPPELGRVDVRLSIDSTGKAQAHLSADQQQTLELLQKDSSGLARALRDAGLNVAQNGLNFSLRQHSSGGGASHGGFSSRGARGQALSAVASLAPSPASLPSGAIPQFMTGRGRLDISV